MTVEFKITCASPGSVENNDVAQMLQKMWLAWFDKKGWTYTIESIPGANVGIQESRIKVTGTNLFLLTQESGKHRVARISPHDVNNRRHTTFTLVTVNGQYNLDFHRSYSFAPIPYIAQNGHVIDGERATLEQVLNGNLDLLH